MAKQRAEIGFGSAFEELDPSEWKPETKETVDKPKPPREEIRKVAQKSGFKSREAPPVTAAVEPVVEAQRPAREGRVFRTGRNEQLNLKVRGDDRAAFVGICDRLHWVQGYTFQRAIEALERELKETNPLPQSLDRSA